MEGILTPHSHITHLGPKRHYSWQSSSQKNWGELHYRYYVSCAILLLLRPQGGSEVPKIEKIVLGLKVTLTSVI